MPPRVPARVSQLSRRVDWAVVMQAARWISHHGKEAWTRLSEGERRELQRMLQKSRGRPGNLTPAERNRLREIVWHAVWSHERGR